MNNHNKKREKENSEYRLIESDRYQTIVISNKKLKNNEILSGLEKFLNENKENNNEEKIISLESVVKNNERYIEKIKYKRLDKLDNYTEKIQDKITLNLVLNAIKSGIDPITNAIIKAVPSSYLPSGNGWRILGMYDPYTHTIYISQDLSHHELVFVYAHEVAHAEGIRDEYVADLRAEQRTGYNLGRKAA